MEDDELETSSGNNLIALALAVLGIVLGAAGLYFGLAASQRINPLTEALDKGTSSADGLARDVAALETRLSELSAQNTELKKSLDRMRLYSNQSEQAVKQVVGAVKDNRAEIVKLANRINDAATQGVRTVRTDEVSSSASTASDQTVSAGSGSAGTYTIESGDTFGRIATKLGVDLQDLLDANAEADPRRLRIGQVINIPGN